MLAPVGLTLQRTDKDLKADFFAGPPVSSGELSAVILPWSGAPVAFDAGCLYHIPARQARVHANTPMNAHDALGARLTGEGDGMARPLPAFWYLHTQEQSCWSHELQMTAYLTKPSF